MPPAALSPPVVGEDRSDFARHVKLDEFRRLAVQHQDQVKILDSWARQSLRAMANRQSIDGQDCLYTALDMAFRQEAWADRDILYIQDVPIREQLARLAGSPAEAQRILHEGLVSPRFIVQPEVRQLLDQISLDTRQTTGVNKMYFARDTFFI